MSKPKPVLLVVLDGWGIRAQRENNAIAIAGTPNVDALMREFPHTAVETSGLCVGLPEGQMGNSEVGHTNLGAGRIVYQDFVRINRAVEDGSFYKNDALLQAARRAKETGGALHLMGLVSDGGVHSHVDHLHACVELARREGVARVFVHAFMDGRDTPPKSGLEYIRQVESRFKETGYAKVASVCGRYFAMDRDKRWDRVAQGYAAVVKGEGRKVSSGVNAMEVAYSEGETDEFVKPSVVTDTDGKPVGAVKDGDAFIFFNFRSDRAREITRAIAEPGFKDFDRGAAPSLSAYVCMTQYDATFPYPIAFTAQDLSEIFPEIVARSGARQLRTAETEKYAHVTFFFNGGRETVYQNEDRILVPSPREVKTYDEKPEMSAREVTDKLLVAMQTGGYGFTLANFANPDMVGHTGILDAAVKAVKVVDECLGRLWAQAQKLGWAMMITADHGNCEMMVDPVTGQPHTAHTLNPVPFILCDPALRGAKLREKGVLADVAPTALQVMGLQQPKEMKGLGLVIR